MSVSAAKKVAQIVSEIAGIQLGDKQQSMVEARLRSRMLKLQIGSESEYLNYLESNKETETEALLSLLTTHHTYFFREFTQFENLLNNQLKPLIAAAEKKPDKKIRVWSAACSRGQEVYSLAMFFDYHLSAIAPHIDFEIYGTDIDNESIQIAKNGVYKTDELNKSPAMYIGDHWIQGKDNVKDYSKLKNKLKSKCRFSNLNLLESNKFILKQEKFDLIFCRNVFIYFNAEQIQSIAKNLLSALSDSGYLILGVSEGLQDPALEIEVVGPSMYQKLSQKSHQVIVQKPAQEIATVFSRKIEVLCVDDSPIIHKLMNSILTPENGFVIKDKAMNGEEALKLLKTKKYDVITLDLHMPVIDGLTFLKMRTDNTPTVVVSSINRDEESIAKQAISYGAMDYVQKPTLENLINSGNEIRAKLKSIVNSRPTPSQKHLKKDKIKTLIVDDSETIRGLLQKIIEKDSAFEVVAVAKNAFEAEKIISQNKPDLITLDIHMPEKDGIQFLKEQQSKQFIPTVMISALAEEDGPYIMEALSSGAIDYIKKPELSELEKLTPIIHERLKVAAKARKQQKRASYKIRNAKANVDLDQIVLIGSSTGGVEALRNIIESLPKEIPPILIVQHIPATFSKAFADRLNSLVDFEVKEATDGDVVLPNKVLIAPGGRQMAICKKDDGSGFYVKINDDPVVNRHRPSVDYLFKSALKAYVKKGCAVILTGMGADGSKEIAALKQSGLITIAQDEATSVVFGMPKEAIATGAVDYVLPLSEIAEKILFLTARKKSKEAA